VRRAPGAGGGRKRRDQMDRLRAAAIEKIIEAVHAGRPGPRHALHVVKFGNASKFLLDCILR
jgi:hypothetical protein